MSRLYQLWPGNNRFWLKGILMRGPSEDFPISIGFYIVMGFALAIYCLFIVETIIRQNCLLFIAFSISYLFTFALMLMSSCTNPGIIPSRPFLQLQITALSKLQRMKSKIKAESIDSGIHIDQTKRQVQPQDLSDKNQFLSKVKDKQKYEQILEYLLYQSQDVNQVFCCTCHIYRPSKASHCSRCGNCILKMDHHCPWVNNCIGQRNYVYFILFIVSLISLMVVFGINVMCFVTHQVDSATSESQSDNDFLYVIVCSVIVGALMIVLVGFLVFHLVLYCKGKTTREYLKGNKSPQKKISIGQHKQDSFYDQQHHSSRRFLSQSNYYKELFHDCPALVNFRQILTEQQNMFVENGLRQIKSKKQMMIKEGKGYSYHKNDIL